MLFQAGNYYIVSVIIIMAALILFMVSFEKRKPKAREVVVLAVMTTIAVVSRVVFFMLPQIKPSAAIIIITGVMLGKQAGFLCGALTAFISDFAFGHGPWTPWQMMAFGLVGFTAALIFHNRRALYYNKAALCIFGFFATALLYGVIMDTGTIFMIAGKPERALLISTYLAGIPFNVIHGITTAVVLWIIAAPMFQKLDRIKTKYGMYYHS